MRPAAELYIQYEALTSGCFPVDSEEEVVDELCDLIRGDGPYESLAEATHLRLVNRQLRVLDPSLNDFELAYHFQEHFAKHFPFLREQWANAYRREVDGENQPDIEPWEDVA